MNMDNPPVLHSFVISLYHGTVPFARD